MTPQQVLKKYWDYDTFRECQAEIIQSVLEGRDTIGLLPTGGGKSITFQVPALMLEGVTIVVTPLISLMKDQVDNLRRRNIAAGCLHSAMTRHEMTLTFDKLRLGKLKLLYLSPERIAVPEFVASIATVKVSLIVVDEAHCISQWGYDFRPSYLKIKNLRTTYPAAPILALTASATPAVVADIADKLAMREHAIYSRSFTRDNISYVVRRCDAIDKDAMLLHILQHTSGTAIVYVRSRRRTAVIAQWLKDQGIPSGFYHAGMMAEDKNEQQDLWMSGEIRVIVATNAFGMGIDKPDVRLVVHYDVPSSLEEYYQEAGRAGRDGLPSYAVLLAVTADKAQLKRRLNDEFPPRKYISEIYEKACVFLNVAVGEGYNRLYEFNFEAFCLLHKQRPRTVASALSILARAGLIEWGEEMGSRSRIMVVADRREFYNIDLPKTEDAVMECIMRQYTGIFADFVPIDETRIAFQTSIAEEDVYQALLSMARMKLIQYIPKRRLPYIYFPTRREETKRVVIPREVYEVQLERAQARIEAMRDYVFNDTSCRVRRMLAYFGDCGTGDCGKCDICRETTRERRVEERRADFETQIDSFFATGRDLTLSEIHRRWDSNATEVIKILRERVDAGELIYRDGIYSQD